MNLVTINITNVRIGHPLPYTLRSADGTLLAQKGFVVESKEMLDEKIGKGVTVYVDVAESEAYRRAYVGKLYDMVLEDKALGKIAGSEISKQDLDSDRIDINEGPPDWLDLQVQANSLLRDTQSDQFVKRLDRFQKLLRNYAYRNPNGALFGLIYLSATEVHLYSATHAMLVSVICGLAAREVLGWSPEHEETLSKAALTMNIGMTELQDRLAQQVEPPTSEQRKLIDEHTTRSVMMLEQLGVKDPLWLEAVRDHHNRSPGRLSSKTEGQRMSRLIQRADMFSARLSPRATRVPTSPAAAMQASYFDEDRQIDEAGAALIKAVGIYSPGSFVRLATNEIAVVIHRGLNTTTPRVALLVNRDGMPSTGSVIRDTSQRDYRIVASVPHREVKVKLNLEQFLTMTGVAASDRQW